MAKHDEEEDGKGTRERHQATPAFWGFLETQRSAALKVKTLLSYLTILFMSKVHSPKDKGYRCM
ncbi:hypothetical protein ACLOJK_032967 [Asimina triloba]